MVKDLQANVAAFWDAMGQRFQGHVPTGRAIITQISRDGAGRIDGALATVDGAMAQSVAIDYGAPIAVGDVYVAANEGGVSTPVWRLVRRTYASSATPPLDDAPTLPTPSGLTLVRGLYEPTLGAEVQAWVNAHWLTLPHSYGEMTYEVECIETTVAFPDGVALLLTTRDPWRLSFLAMDISSTDATIPRVVSGDVFSIGRIQIEQEEIDFTAGTSDTGLDGVNTGVGSPNAWYDVSASWADGEWQNYALRDADFDYFRITGNDSDTLTVMGTPVSGLYRIYPAFCDCTRGVGSTDAVAHSAADSIIARSWGILFDGLRPNTDYSFRVRATNDAGALSGWTAWASIQTDPDLTIPPTPTGFAVESADAGVVLTWTGPTINTTPDLAGFYVYQAPNGTPDPGDITKVKEVGLRNETFVEAPLATELYYAITAYDTSMNESPKTAWLTAYAYPAVIVNPGQLLFTRTAELSEELTITARGIQSDSPPEPGFTPSSTEISAGESITFTNTSIGAAAYLWDFGDGESSEAFEPAHTYETAGVFSVRLTCYSEWGEQYIVGKTPITVNRDPGVSPPRITAGLQYLALFDEGAGGTVYDQSEVGLAYNMAIEGSGTWHSDGLFFSDEDTTIFGGVPFSKVIDACMATNEITLEAWVQRDTDNHWFCFFFEAGGCILANSAEEEGDGNFLLSQTKEQQYEIKLRTSATDLGGLPSLSGGTADLDKVQQVVYTRDSSGNAKLYIDAVLVTSMTVGGDFSTWQDDFRFSMSDRVSSNTPWLGLFDLVAIYDTALSQADIETNLMAGGGDPGPPPGVPTAAFSFNPTSGDKPLAVTITESSTGDILSYAWDLGDGGTSTERNPGIYVYQNAGVWSPSLTVTNLGGSNTEIKEAYVTVNEGGEPPPGDGLYVSPNGDDGSGDGSFSNPWKTVQKGVDEIKKGDILYLRGVGDSGHGEGVYHEDIVIRDKIGASDAWYTIRNHPGENPIIDGLYNLPDKDSSYTCPSGSLTMHLKGLVKVFDSAYIKWDGIDIKRSSGRGFDATTGDGGHHLTITNSKIYSCRASVTKFVNWDNATVTNCDLYDSMNYCKERRSAGEGSPWSGACSILGGKDHYVNNVLVYNSYGEGIHAHSWLRGEVSDCVIFNCTNGMLPTTCCDGTVTQRNFVYSTRDYPFDRAAMLNVTMEANDQDIRRMYSQNCTWVNNIIVDGYICNRFMDRLSKEGEYQWGFYKNSLIAHNTMVLHHNYNEETRSLIRWLNMHHTDCIALIDISNNVFWFDGPDDKIVETDAGSPDYNYNCWSQKPSASKALDSNDIYDDPRLEAVDTTGSYKLSSDGSVGIVELRKQAKRFRLTTGSPAIGEGKNLSGDVPEDFWGHARSSSPDMGAHES